MTLSELQEKIIKWDRHHTGPPAEAKYSIIFDQLSYHASHGWETYLPTDGCAFSSDYMERLAAWIGNADNDADQKLMLEYASYISFFCNKDFNALYQTAYHREAAPWIAQQMGIDLLGGLDSYNARLQNALKWETWYCPVTDSMKINEFYKVNHIMGAPQRPIFDSLHKMSEDPVNPQPNIGKYWSRYMDNPSPRPANDTRPSLDYLVLLEDVVGSSSQSIDIIRWAVTELGRPVLFIPLILCPNGVDSLKKEVKKLKGRLTVKPVIELKRVDLLGPERKGQQGWKISDSVESLAQRTVNKLGIPPSEVFGYRETGCSLATYSNTPDNSLPMIHRSPRTETWKPLFPRVHRGD